MIIDFSGRRVLVTGSTAGIGFAVAAGFARAGASVVINGRSRTGVNDAVARLANGRGAVAGFVGDLGTEADCRRLANERRDIDILINNLGIYEPEDLLEAKDSTWNSFFQTNVMSGIRLARAYAPRMVRRGWGRIVFVSSEAALNIPTDMIHYGFTKAAQLAISRGLAKRLAGTGVTVNTVLPGLTLTEGRVDLLMSEAASPFDGIEAIASDFLAHNHSSSIIGRAMSAEEVANMILYVSSDQASATTGAGLRVDGGIVDSIL